MRTFVTDSENYETTPIDIISTDLFTVAFKEFEKDFFLWMLISHDNNYKNDYSTNNETNFVLFNDKVSSFNC